MQILAGGIFCGPNSDRIFGDRVEIPDLLAGLCVIGAEKSADAVFAAVGADQHFALHDGGRHRLAVAELGIGNVGLPDLLAGLGVERHQLGIKRGEIDLVLEHRHAAVVGPAAIGGDRPELRLVVPELLAGLGVERVDLAERGGDVHDPVHHDGRGLERFAHVGLEDPGRVQAAHVRGVDLGVRIKPPLRVIAVAMQEVAVVAARAAQHLLGDVARHDAGLCRRRPCLLLDLLRHACRRHDACRRNRERNRAGNDQRRTSHQSLPVNDCAGSFSKLPGNCSKRDGAPDRCQGWSESVSDSIQTECALAW